MFPCPFNIYIYIYIYIYIEAVMMEVKVNMEMERIRMKFWRREETGDSLASYIQDDLVLCG